MTSAADSYSSILERLRREGNLRRIPAGDSPRSGITDLSSNDYLGLASMDGLQEEFFADEAVRRIPMTSSASRLLSASQDEYARLEQLLEDLYGRPALLFNSGYHANTGIIPALATGKTLIVADKLVHASIIDGIMLSKAPFTRFRHNDYAHLRRILNKEASAFDRVIIIAESVYSMDGDRADISRLAEIKRSVPGAILYIDEAHGFGTEGLQGLGLCKGSDCYEDVDLIIGTFGKACASVGAFCAVSPLMRDYLLNRSRSFIFSTALPPLNVAWTRFMVERITSMDSERERLRGLGEQLQSILQPLSPDFRIEASHIQPLVTGSAESAVSLSARLLDDGFKVLPIRTPTVPPGTERLRISLSSALSPDDIDRLGHSLRRHLSDMKR